jgi:histidinol-phosphatase
VNPDLQLALELADAADALTMRSFQSNFAVRTKEDRTPVTEVDEAVERAIRERLARERPGDGIVGEEFGAVVADASSAGQSDRHHRWIIDPIDGTKNFIRGIPMFATLIATDDVGVVSAPALHRRWWASRGEGAFCNGRAIRVSNVADLANAQFCFHDIASFELAGLGAQFFALARGCARASAPSDFWSHMLVAEGAAEIAIDVGVKLWDMAAIKVIVEEAGGRFSDLRGERRADGGSGVSTNALLHDAALAAMQV